MLTSRRQILQSPQFGLTPPSFESGPGAPAGLCLRRVPAKLLRELGGYDHRHVVKGHAQHRADRT